MHPAPAFSTNILVNIVGNRVVDFVKLTEYLKSFARKLDLKMVLHAASRWLLQGKLPVIPPEPHYTSVSFSISSFYVIILYLIVAETAVTGRYISENHSVK
jgi:hypothetical protein